jgi:hypothetical protein
VRLETGESAGRLSIQVEFGIHLVVQDANYRECCVIQVVVDDVLLDRKTSVSRRDVGSIAAAHRKGGQLLEHLIDCRLVGIGLVASLGPHAVKQDIDKVLFRPR